VTANDPLLAQAVADEPANQTTDSDPHFGSWVM